MSLPTITIRNKQYPEPSIDRLKRKAIRELKPILARVQGEDLDAVWDLVGVMVPTLDADTLDDLDMGECKALLQNSGVARFDDAEAPADAAAVEAEGGITAGGIFGLDRLLDEWGEAIEADLIERGLRLRDLGSAGFTWSDLRAIVRHLPTTSAYWRAREPEGARWGVAEYLLAVIADSLRWLVWAKTKDAKRNRNRPKPIPRPGDAEKKQAKGTFTGAVSHSVDEVKRLLSLPRRKLK